MNRKDFYVFYFNLAVQNERDKISNRPLAYDAISSGQSLFDLQQLLTAENRAQNVSFELVFVGPTYRFFVFTINHSCRSNKIIRFAKNAI